MHYLLDTDITSYLIKRNDPHHEPVLKKLLSHSPGAISISVITVSEIASGLKQIPDHNPSYKKRVREAFEHFITTINISDFTLTAALIYGDIRATLKSKGEDIGAMDCLIAASAISEKRILVTNNVKHFSRIKNLKLENWTK